MLLNFVGNFKEKKVEDSKKMRLLD
jgi:hypothetical protein